jgi:hypothetical protein
MLDYTRQAVICKSVQETIKKALTQSDDVGARIKVYNIPTTESILRAVSLLPSIDTEESLKDFINEHILGTLRLTVTQKEYFNLNG